MASPDPDRAHTDAGPNLSAGSDTDATTSDVLVCLRDESHDGTIRFALSGELDIATAPELDQALRTAQQTAGLVTVDLRRLSFMDCRGLAVIITAAKRASANGGSFRVVRGPPHVHRLFTLTDADRQIEIASTG